MGNSKNHADGGHVFVVRGKLQNLDVDAVVVPTDWLFSVGHKWRDLWAPDLRVEDLKPVGWASGSADLSRADPDDPNSPAVWSVDVAVDGRVTEAAVVRKIVAGVTKVIERNADRAGHHGRGRRLVAIPTLGVGHGGLGLVKGELIAGLLEGVEAAAALHRVDAVIVAYEKADYAAFQHIRRSHPSWLKPELDRSAQDLATKARHGDLALFVGAGVSMSSGLPSWKELIGTLGATVRPQLTETDMKVLNNLDLAELVSIENVEFRDTIKKKLTGARPGLGHALLAGLDCEDVVTTNFDLLYEAAANYTEDNQGLTVLPWDRLDERRPWILKMHGDIEHRGSIVLARSDFVGYGAMNGPAGATVQALMMSRHLLVVGASMTDDNFLRLAYEVQAFRRLQHAEEGKLGAVLTLEPQSVKQRLFKDSFDYISVSEKSAYPDKARDLNIFLDALGMYAADRFSFLLDHRYQSMLPAGSTAVAEALAELAPRLRGLAFEEPSGPWAALWKSLQRFGASA